VTEVPPEPAPAPAPVVPPAPAPAPVVVTPPAPAPAPTPAPTVAQGTPEQELAKTAEMQGVRGAANAAESRKLVEQGRNAQNANDYQTALNLYSRAADLDPSNDAAKVGRDQMLTLTGRSAAPTSPLDRVEQNIKARRQQVTYNFDTAIAEARTATANGDYAAASTALDRARVARNEDPNIFTEPEIRNFETQIANAQLALSRAQETASAQSTRTQQVETAGRIRAQQTQAEQERQRTVAD